MKQSKQRGSRSETPIQGRSSTGFMSYDNSYNSVSLQVRRGSSRGVSRVISFTSGKGGVGKTSLVVNTAISLSRAGRSVLVLDADLGLANVDVMLGIRPIFTLLDVLEGRKRLDEIILDGPEGIAIIPATSGSQSICNLDTARQLLLLQAVEELQETFDYLLIDTQAGISSDVMYFNSASAEIVCVITGEPTSLTDAYALIKVLSQNYGERQVQVISNNVRDERDGLLAFQRLAKAVERFLHVDLEYLGFVPSDASLCEAVRNQRAMVDLYPSSKASVAIGQLSRKIDSNFHELRVKGGMQFFFNRLVEVSSAGR